MARRTILTLIDDLDGDAADETVAFALDGVTYEIDLSSDNADQLRGALDPYMQAGRRTGGRRRRTRAETAGDTAPRAAAARSGARAALTVSVPAGHDALDRAAVRAWARDAGVPVSDRGRIPRAVMDQYLSAHADK